MGNSIVASRAQRYTPLCICSFSDLGENCSNCLLGVSPQTPYERPCRGGCAPVGRWSMNGHLGRRKWSVHPCSGGQKIASRVMIPVPSKQTSNVLHMHHFYQLVKKCLCRPNAAQLYKNTFYRVMARIEEKRKKALFHADLRTSL